MLQILLFKHVIQMFALLA